MSHRFVDGARATRDRTGTNPAGFTVTATGFTTPDESYSSWRNQDQVEVVHDSGNPRPVLPRRPGRLPLLRAEGGRKPRHRRRRTAGGRTEVTHPGQQYADAVGIWAGISMGTTLSHNDVGYAPYSGISTGWGWGWASDCTLQAKQGLATPCRHGTTYNGGLRIIGNHVHSVMGELNDGGPICTNGGSATPSEFAGNVLGEGIDGCNAIYHDEGSALRDTHDNVVHFVNGCEWTHLWTPTIHDVDYRDNYADTGAYTDNGTDIAFTQATVVPDEAWPPAAASIIAAAGTGRPPGPVADDDDLRIAYAGAWSSSGSRGFGDLDDGVHYTTADGASATFSFTGRSVRFLTETNSDEGDIAITLDGRPAGTVSASAETRSAQQAVYAVGGLRPGRHTVSVTKQGGSYLVVDGFVAP